MINQMICKAPYLAAAITMLEQQSALNSGSQVSRKCNSSFIMPRILLELIRANDSSMARLTRRKWCQGHNLSICIYRYKCEKCYNYSINANITKELQMISTSNYPGEQLKKQNRLCS